MELLSFRKVATYLINILFILFTIMLLWACASNTPNNIYKLDASTSKKLKTNSEVLYTIGPGDVLEINVWKNKELSVTLPVRPDGKLSMPLIGDVQAEGLVPEEIARNIVNKLSIHIRKPVVSVMVTELHSNEYLYRIRVTGAVEQPASFSYQRGMTVLDAVLAAGGINEFASPNSTKVYRKSGSDTDIIAIKLGDILYKGKLKTNIALIPGDIITVPERLF